MTGKNTLVATTALVLCICTSVAAQPSTAAWAGQRHDIAFSRDTMDRNARLFSWFGVRAPHNANSPLYAQSASSGFSTYAISSWAVWGSAPSYCCQGPMAADDFVIPGKGRYTISAVYSPGMTFSGGEPSYIHVTFFDALKYSRRTGKTTVAVKATCDTKSFSDTSGRGNFLADVSSCQLGKFRGGHDYSVSVQPWFWSNGSWAWQTNRNQIGRQAFFVGYAGNGPCYAYFTPVKTCFPGKGYGPDLAFAIYGRKD